MLTELRGGDTTAPEQMAAAAEIWASHDEHYPGCAAMRRAALAALEAVDEGVDSAADMLIGIEAMAARTG